MDADVAQQSVVIINTTLQLLVIYRYGWMLEIASPLSVT